MSEEKLDDLIAYIAPQQKKTLNETLFHPSLCKYKMIVSTFVTICDITSKIFDKRYATWEIFIRITWIVIHLEKKSERQKKKKAIRIWYSLSLYFISNHSHTLERSNNAVQNL